MNELEKVMLKEAAGENQPKLCLRTGTLVDAGLWGRRVPLWLCVTDDSLVLLAVGRRRYMQVVGFADCMKSGYCHATGEFVIRPVEGLVFNRVKMSPAEALQVSALLPGAGGITSERSM